MLAALLKETRETKESLKEEFQKSLEKNSQESREREERSEKRLQESLEKSSQETKASLERNSQETKERLESFKEDLQEIKTSQMKIEYNLKKEIQELQEQWKMDINERENKLQKSIDQVQGDVEKTEEELTKKTEENVEENRTEMEEKITEVTQMQKQCNDMVEKIEENVEETGIDMEERITEMTQKQNQCNDVIEGIEEKQKQLAVNLRNAGDMPREDYQRGAIEGEDFTCGIKRKKGTTDNDQFGGELLKKCWPKSRQCAALEDPLRCKPLSNWKGASEEIARHWWKGNETLEQPLNDNVMISAIKRRMNQKRQGTISRSPIKGSEALMKILEQLEYIKSQKYKQAKDRNRKRSNDPRIHINHSSDFRGRGGGTAKPNDSPDEVRSRVRAIMTQNKHARTWLGQLAVKWTIERKGFVYMCALCYITVSVAYFMSKTISE
ncbi:interaptin-like [Schistocerca nitens]|uniref:interaptin-like n=1 Tax=Schistocerca nitens TaxID=7011 RepID=UPI0021182E08|nr:interaptin-like [Schistocerca nitens]